MSFYTCKNQMFLFNQAQEDLKLARSTDTSADLLKLEEEIKQAEIRIEQMTAERDTLMERLKVSPRVMPFMVYIISVHHYAYYLLQRFIV